MLQLRTRIKKTTKRNWLRKKVSALRNINNHKNPYLCDAINPKKDSLLNIVTLFPNAQ